MDNLVPYPDKLSFQEKLQLYLFNDNSEIPEYHQFTAREMVIKTRFASVFSYWVHKPMLSDKKIVQFMITQHHVSRSQAYRELPMIKLLLGNVRNAAKEWQRYKLIAILDRAQEIAEKRQDVKAMIMAADKLGKYTQLDKEDPPSIPYEDIVPQNFEITGDVSVLGIKPMKNLREVQKKLREKYGAGPMDHIEDAIVEDD